MNFSSFSLDYLEYKNFHARIKQVFFPFTLQLQKKLPIDSIVGKTIPVVSVKSSFDIEIKHIELQVSDSFVYQKSDPKN